MSIRLSNVGVELSEKRWKDIWESIDDKEHKEYFTESGVRDMFLIGYELGVSDTYLRLVDPITKETIH